MGENSLVHVAGIIVSIIFALYFWDIAGTKQGAEYYIYLSLVTFDILVIIYLMLLSIGYKQ